MAWIDKALVKNRYEWNRWFAWYPVKLYPMGPAWISGGYVWLHWVECRIHGEVAPNGDLTDWWEYRLPADRT